MPPSLRGRPAALSVLGVLLLVDLVLVRPGAVYGQPTPQLTPKILQTDYRGAPGSSSNANGVLEPGETVQVAPFWTNASSTPVAFTGAASGLTGPPGPTYTLGDATADYGTAAGGATVDCNGATGDCYLLTVSGTRPVAHWDVTFTENLSFSSVFQTWTVHIGNSFSDVLTSNQFYFFVESLFHSGVTGGCGVGVYCPDNAVTRAQMAVFLLKAEHGPTYAPPDCSPTFGDVPCPSLFAAWVEQLFHEGITGGCGGGNFCPNAPVTRAQMAVLILKAEHGSAYRPPDCTPTFGDVPCPSAFAAWIERLFDEGITGGCGGGNYCPDAPNNRGQMAVFLDKLMQLPGPPPATATRTPTPLPPTLTATITPSPFASHTPTSATPTPTTTGGQCAVNCPSFTPTRTLTPTPTTTGGMCAVNCPSRTPTRSPTPG